MQDYSFRMLDSGTVTYWLNQLRQGDASALEQLMPIVYDELHLVARQRLKKERPGHTFGATALINEVYLKLVDQKQLDISDRGEFMAVASRIMRNILVDYARARKRLKRGGGVKPVPLEDVEAFLSEQEVEEVLALDTALDKLALQDERASKVVQYRFFGGLTLKETADVLGVSQRSVQRSWTVARLWLRKEVASLIE